MPTQIPITELVIGKCYVGRGRNGNVGLRDGVRFLVIGEKFEDYVIKMEPYYTADSGCFQPFAVVDEGVMVEPFGKTIWDRHYGRRLEFGTGAEDSGNVRALAISAARFANENRNLTGLWKGSTYLPDGLRTNVTLTLNADATFLHEWIADPPRPNAPPQNESGVWHHVKEDDLLILTSVKEAGEPHNSRFQIL